MTEVSNESIRQLRDAIIGTTPKSAQPTYARATVTAAGSGGTWVRIEGADGVTPVSSSVASVQPGDTVTVRIGNGECAITGNTTDAAVGQRVTQPIKQAAVEAVDVATAANESAAVAASAAETAHSAAQSAVQSAADAGRAAAVAQAAMGSTTVDWHDYRVEVGDDGQWHVYHTGTGNEIPLSRISMVYQDINGLHVLGESSRLDVGSGSVEVFDAKENGESLASFGKGGARVGNGSKAHTEVTDSTLTVIDDTGNPTFLAENQMVVVGSPFDNHVRVSPDGISLNSLDEGIYTVEKAVDDYATHDENKNRFIGIASGYSEQEQGVTRIEIKAVASVVKYSTTPKLEEISPLILIVDGEQVAVSATISKPRTVEPTKPGGNTFVKWDVVWTYDRATNTTITIDGSVQLGQLFGIRAWYPVALSATIKATFFKPTYARKFYVESDGNVTASGNVTAVDMSASGNLTASNVTASGTVSNGSTIAMDANWFFYGYITGSSKGVRACIPLPGFGWTSATVSGTASYTIRGGSGATVTGTTSSIDTVGVRNGGSVLYLEWTLGSAFAGGNNVAISGFVSGLTVTLE